MKKILSVFLVLLMLVPFFSMQTFAWEEEFSVEFEKDGIYYYQTEENEVYAWAYEPASEEEGTEELVIPETVKYNRETYVVTGIDDEAFFESHYSKVILPETIEYMGDDAFWGSAMLEEIVIPDTCEFEYFGANAFTGTPAEGRFFEKDVNVIGKNVLYSYMSQEKEFTIPDYITILASGCFMYSGIEKVTFNENITEIPDVAFCCCMNLKEITIPDGIIYLGDSAFKDCINLEKVTLGKDVQYIALSCFANTKIETIHLGAAVEDVQGAFHSCNNLKNVTVDENNKCYYTDENALYRLYEFESFDENGKEIIEKYPSLEYYFGGNTAEGYKVKNDIEEIGMYAFYNCKTLKSIDLSDVTYIGTKAFANSAIENVKLDSCDYISEAAFTNCKNLKEIDLSNVASVGVSAFENCTNLKTVVLGDYLSFVDGLAFANTAIEKIEIYGEDTFVGEDAFKSCKELKEVTFGDGVWYIGSNVLRYCDKVESVYISKTVQLLEDDTFADCEHINFKLIKGSYAYKHIKALGYDFEIVGRLTFFESIAEFFRSVYDFLFGWIFNIMLY
ncbi:MAG: leucine-rich repeat protein [Clostridia bacterium]|nr:leucine-rich repeat protein [Clostridia bacterium]